MRRGLDMIDDERLGNNLERYGVLDNEIWDWMFSNARWIGTNLKGIVFG